MTCLCSRSRVVDDDPCRSLPCQNGAQCESVTSEVFSSGDGSVEEEESFSTRYMCSCRPGTTGRQCETGISLSWYLLVINRQVLPEFIDIS